MPALLLIPLLAILTSPLAAGYIGRMALGIMLYWAGIISADTYSWIVLTFHWRT